ncbi:hypothetical protein CWE09_00900 [Aliidiomarina minuta]|uniref:Uncharacterized protein n=1 Tax=Aliidiomarina minuta TaxID=880057 RepID=A0A432W5I0_9GAMM|nr:hypothetical protein [Aliidiomarina minuta]RUO25325.1 hypothetical protein CWE09_00900 [Aliidiomarina minuta]
MLNIGKLRSSRRQIEDAQRDLLHHRQVIKARKLLLKGQTRQHLSSKKALLAAGGTGFMLEQLTHGPRGNNAKGGLDMNTLLRVALKVMTLSQLSQSISQSLFGSSE